MPCLRRLRRSETRNRPSAGSLRVLPVPLLLFHGVTAGQQNRLDSLEMERLRLQIQTARIAVTSTDFLHRLTPHLAFTASVGAREMIFFEPETGQTSFLPRDAYRLTVSLSLTDLFDTRPHETAVIERNLRMLDLEVEKARQSQRRAEALRKADNLRTELAGLMDQADLHRRIERYYSMLFEEGKVQFDALANSRLRLLETNMRAARVRAELQQILEKQP